MGSASDTTRPWQVLVVDDDGDVRDGLRDWLEAEGFDVDVACDGVDALGRADTHSLDAIVCDLDMPRLQGMDVVRRLRRRGSDMVVVLLSGRFDLLANARDLGQVYAMAKPFSPERLVRTLREALEGRS
jgi:two-component system response regulator MprA